MVKNWQLFVFVFLIMAFLSCNKEAEEEKNLLTKEIYYNGISVDVVIDKPQNNAVDVLMVFHGTVWYDSRIMEAANNALRGYKQILNRDDMMLVSVAYPEENLFIGDNVLHAEAALLWLKNHASEELGVTVKKIFLSGHSQGGYIVTRLNTMHETDGVIANAPGPFNLVYRCQLEEDGQIPKGIACNLLRSNFGTTEDNPDAYFERSLLNFTNGFKADILFVQGLHDSAIQMHSWPVFKQQVSDCADCKHSEFLELPGYGHNGLFQSPQAQAVFNDFINDRSTSGGKSGDL